MEKAKLECTPEAPAILLEALRRMNNNRVTEQNYLTVRGAAVKAYFDKMGVSQEAQEYFELGVYTALELTKEFVRTRST